MTNPTAESNLILPNSILLGAQKAGTSSYFSWIAQHPEVCGPEAVKDFPFFLNDDYYQKGFAYLSGFYKEYNHEPIILAGCVNYIYFSKAIERLYNFNPDLKLLLVLRNPVERAFSAYQYFKMLSQETADFPSAIQREKNEKQSSYHFQTDFTYVDHGLYYKQLKILLQYFNREQLHIILFDDLKAAPEHEMKKTFAFLNINTDFTPTLESVNPTGNARFPSINKVIFQKSAWRKKLVNMLIDPFIPLSKRTLLKNKLKSLNTSNKTSTEAIPEDMRQYLAKIYQEDVEQLSAFLNRDLSHWLR